MKRITVSLPEEIHRQLRERARARRTSLGRIVVETLRAGLRLPPAPAPPPLPVFDMGEPSVNLDQALQLAGEMEDEEIIRKMEAGK